MKVRHDDRIFIMGCLLKIKTQMETTWKLAVHRTDPTVPNSED